MTYDPEGGIDFAAHLAESILPDGISTQDEIEIHYERDEYATKVVATLGEASITVEASEDGASIIPWLLSAMPSVLNNVMDAINNEDPQEGQ